MVFTQAAGSGDWFAFNAVVANQMSVRVSVHVALAAERRTLHLFAHLRDQLLDGSIKEQVIVLRPDA